MKSVLVTGGSGLIGSYFLKTYSNKIKDNQIIAPSHQDMDITNIDSIKGYFDKYQPSAVIHFAAFRNATEAEKQRGDKNGSVWKINVEGSNNIARVCQKGKCFLIHISTDYIFAGDKRNPGPYHEKDQSKDADNLLSWYGVTKREAERRVLENLDDVSITRICNITRPGNVLELDYVGKILWLYNKGKIYSMFNDQSLTLTYIPSLGELIVKLLLSKKGGIYHVSTNNLTTPHDVANYLIEKMYGRKNAIKPASIDSYLKKHTRRYPKWGGLKVVLTQQKMGLKFMNWEKAVDSFVEFFKKNEKK